MEINEPRIQYHKVGSDISSYNLREYRWPYTLTVGRIAESLVQELFLMEGYHTYKYGMEHIYQRLYKDIKKNTSPCSESIKKSPDLIIYNPCNEQINYAEVKFRSTKCFVIDDNGYEKYAERFPGGYFFLVTPTDFYCIPFEEMCRMGKFEFTENGRYSLVETDFFDIRNKSIEHFQYFLSVFFNKEFLKKNSQVHGKYGTY